MTPPRRHKHVANLSEIEGHSQSQGSRFGSTYKPLAFSTGARGIGASWYELPPGRTAYPRHFHCVNEEAMFVLEGEGSLRIGEDTVPIKAGDYATFPVGPKHAHQVKNTGTAPLRFLALSTLITADVVGYPDSKKIGASARSPDSPYEGKPWIRTLTYEDAKVGYFDGEDAG